MFKDFMSLLLTICGHNHSKKCKRLFLAYKTALFQEININGMEVWSEIVMKSYIHKYTLW